MEIIMVVIIMHILLMSLVWLGNKTPSEVPLGEYYIATLIFSEFVLTFSLIKLIFF